MAIPVIVRPKLSPEKLKGDLVSLIVLRTSLRCGSFRWRRYGGADPWADNRNIRRSRMSRRLRKKKRDGVNFWNHFFVSQLHSSLFCYVGFCPMRLHVFGDLININRR